MEENLFPGALEDTRSPKLKQKDWHKEVVLGNFVEWKEKTFKDVQKFPVRNQDGSGSCVMQTCDLMMGIENFLEEGKFIEFSADLYNYRSNNTPGMIGVDALELLRKKGLTLEVLLPSMNKNDSQIAELKRKTSDDEIAKIFTIKDYYQSAFNVDAIATIMESGRINGVAKPVMVWFEFPRVEWDSKPDVTNSTYDLVRHSVTAIEYGIMNGVKGIFIQDSWGLHTSTENGLRFISEDYIKARMIFCAYVNDKLNDWQSHPEFVFERTLRKGMKGEDVKELQRLLFVTVDGVFGPLTEKSVKRFQEEKGLKVDGVVGPKTLELLIND
jgi:hypothetical protein